MGNAPKAAPRLRFVCSKSVPPLLSADWNLINQLSAAERELARLNGLARNLTNPHLLIGPFVRREAVLSSRIEGTQASLSDLFFFEAAGNPAAATPMCEVANHVRQLDYVLHRPATLPASVRLMGSFKDD